MHQTRKSTKVPVTEPRETAAAVAREMERIGREGKSHSTKRVSKEEFEIRVAALMRASGVETPVKNQSWKEAAASYLEESTAGESSKKKYQGEIDQFTAFLGVRANAPVRHITHEDCLAFYKELIDAGRKAKTARNTTKTIRGVLKRAHLLGYLDNNPAGLLRLKSAGDDSTRLPFTSEDLTAIFKHLAETGNREWEIICYFGLYYGMRVGDATRRHAGEIRTENGIEIIRFVPQKKRATGREIALPIVGELKRLLEGKEGPFTPHAAQLAHPGRPFEKIMKDAGIVRRFREAQGKGRASSDKSFHSFRHTANSLLVDAGVDARVRQLICDHDDAKMNARYTHAGVQTMSAAIEKAMGSVVKR